MRNRACTMNLIEIKSGLRQKDITNLKSFRIFVLLCWVLVDANTKLRPKEHETLEGLSNERLSSLGGFFLLVPGAASLPQLQPDISSSVLYQAQILS